MTKRDHDKHRRDISRIPAWFIACVVYGMLIGFTAWSVAEFRFDMGLERALELLPSSAERVEVRNELDLAAQQTMATSAIIAAILSGFSMAFVAATVYFSYNSLNQSHRALEETLAVSRRELMPYLVANAFCHSAHDAIEIDDRSFFLIKIFITNYGQTPCYIKYIRSYIKDGNTIHAMANPRKREVRKTIASKENHTVDVAFFSALKAFEMRDTFERSTLYIQIVSGDIFYDDREDHLKYTIASCTPELEGDYYHDMIELRLEPDGVDNPLRSWVGTMDGGIKYDPSVKTQL